MLINALPLGAKKVVKPGRPKPDGPPAPKKSIADLP